MHLDADKCAYFEKNVFFSGIVVVDPWHTTGGAKRSLEPVWEMGCRNFGVLEGNGSKRADGTDVGKGGRWMVG